ncbi:2-polyprenyl-6-methoxyphenol hydroxylase-like FAD-dependent oxidoreductase [Nocardia transvalensis]|uniref:2-polyprenyl-6-methoxyphenol hydroxylase-like FAD-dependent oxidoreductase n=1 Tax=Nocardia transvalensis TaxID=37333 RepID=A0A7W9PIX8_9NOCA|nr:FAD-dependent monooxygenase [Nocardia transvalensis]MBB5916313.1 2-polyprenyl-6-methoxyphenol hydroxylase-like FAD-dependent oxidoreductase [Nocardia transvalensis]
MNTSAHTPRVLVSGGGIAGNAVALQLLRAGIPVTVVERAATPRPGGQAVDLRGPSREVAERMGLMPGIRKYQLHELGMCYVDAAGREFASMPMEMFDGKGPVAEIEITRGDLNQVLLDALTAAGGDLDYRYGEWIEALRQDDSGVEVTFGSGRTERFDVVVGADGVHSATRRLAFGPEERFATFLGGYMAFFTVPTPPDVRPGWFALHAVPSAAVGIRPDGDPSTSKAIITLRTDANPALRRDVSAQRQLVRDMLAPAGWHAPMVLEEMRSTPDFYFDELARIDMPTLSAGRVTLAGDAGYCGSPMTGMGTAMALVGAYILAGEIAATPADVPAALARYEEKVTPFLDEAKQLPGGGIKMMLPHSRIGAAAARTAARVMMSRPLRPVMMKAMFSKTDSYELPAY